MRFTVLDGKVFIPRDEAPIGYGDFVAEVVGESRYISPDRPLEMPHANPEKGYGCYGQVILDGPRGPQIAKEPRVCDVCAHRVPCRMGAERALGDYAFTSIPGRALTLRKPFDMERFKRENQFVPPTKLTRKRVKDPEDFVWPV